MPARAFANIWREHGLYSVAPTNVLLRRTASDVLYYPLDGHWNTGGHGLAAKTQVGAIESWNGFE